ncbi:hypothetical protein F52700_5433 [Fusarium sp. NRRL 52700]|nr:hypothetical protein F52700_5433 [Fusarium sp. NRRL 52700]
MIDLASVYYGLFLGVFIFTFAKAVSQTRAIYKRTHSLHNAYLYMIWSEAVVNFVFALITFLYLNGIIPGNLGFLLATVILWSIQTQLLPQIIANRVSLIMTNRRRARHLKWGLVVCILFVNGAVCYIFTVAHLDTATPVQKHTNMIFEKCEKTFFLIIDLALNIYVQFAPLAYIVKLYIELLMANLISKVVRGNSRSQGEGWYSSSRDKSNPTNYGLTSRVVVTTGPPVPTRGSNMMSRIGKDDKDLESNEGNNGSQVHLATFPEPHGITKTVETTVVVGDGESDRTF